MMKTILRNYRVVFIIHGRQCCLLTAAIRTVNRVECEICQRDCGRSCLQNSRSACGCATVLYYTRKPGKRWRGHSSYGILVGGLIA